MRFGDWRNTCLALRRSRLRRVSSRQLKYRLRAVICLFLYTHNFWANGVSKDAVVLSRCSGKEQCVAAQSAQSWETPAPKASEAQS